MNIIDEIIKFVNEMSEAKGEVEQIKEILEDFGMQLVNRSPEDRARLMAFVGLVVMDLALCAEEADGSYASASLTARSIVKSTEETLIKLGIQPDFLGVCVKSLHSPRVMLQPKAEEDYTSPDIVWN